MPTPRLLAGVLAPALAHITLAAGPAEASPLGRDPVRCLALAMYWEARAEGREGMLAVASVVLNRVGHQGFPDTVCEVVTEGGETPPCQFSWFCDGRSDHPTEARAWRQAEQIATETLRRAPRDLTGGALFFHATSLSDPWHVERQRTARIGRHVFYR